MTNPRVQNIIRTKVSEISKEFECQPSKGFIIFCLQNIYGLDDFEVEEAITDGGNDKGIDAIFPQSDENGNKILFIVQSKFYDNPAKQLDEPAKTLMIETVRNYILEDAPTNVLNSKLKPIIESARKSRQSGEIDKVMLVFITNGQRPQPTIYDDLDRFRNQQVDYRIFTEQEIAEFTLPQSTKPTGKISLKVSKEMGAGERTFLSLPDIDQSKGKVVRVDVYEIAKLVENNPNIFNSNVRGYLGKNKVNDKIKETLSDKSLIETFIYLNNGITILCDSYQIKAGNEMIDLVNPSIINGCQTASTITEVYKLDKLKPNTGLVLVRIIESADPRLKESIIKASNTQSVVNNRDLISEDDIQKELEAQFLTMGYYYQRKRGAYIEIPKNKKDKIVDLEKAAQAYMALFLEKPAEAKNKKSEIYNDYYKTIFNNQINATTLLISFKLLEWFKNKIKEHKKDYTSDEISLFGNALLHLLPLFNFWVLIPGNVIINEFSVKNDALKIMEHEFKKNYSRVFNRLRSVMVSVVKNDSEFKNYQYFFKSSGSLDKLLSSPKGEVDYQLELNKDNYKKRDLRYTKPQEYSLDGHSFTQGGTWQDLFVILVEEYVKKFPLEGGSLSFIDSGDRLLLTKTINDEDKKLRKKLKDELWLLTNFDSRRICNFCFAIADELKVSLVIKIKPTKYRIDNKF